MRHRFVYWLFLNQEQYNLNHRNMIELEQGVIAEVAICRNQIPQLKPGLEGYRLWESVTVKGLGGHFL
jgi:hypothetical protein